MLVLHTCSTCHGLHLHYVGMGTNSSFSYWLQKYSEWVCLRIPKTDTIAVDFHVLAGSWDTRSDTTSKPSEQGRPGLPHFRRRLFGAVYMCALPCEPLTWAIACLIDLVVYSVVERGPTSARETLKHAMLKHCQMCPECRVWLLIFKNFPGRAPDPPFLRHSG